MSPLPAATESVPSARRVFSPLDEELQFLPGGLSPYLHEAIDLPAGRAGGHFYPLELFRAVALLFCYRAKRVARAYLNHAVIPALCRKTGVPEHNAL